MNLSASLAPRMLVRGLANAVRQRPLSVSFEITHYCTANCWHCNWGGPVPSERRASAEDYARICRELNPVIAHISGGEPLARNDVFEIVRAMANPGGLPWMVLVTNASTLTVDKYLRLREAGINQFSVSLDFPDDRHDDFRRIPGLFAKLNRVIPEITALRHGDLSLNVCITAWNFRDLPSMVELAERWNTVVNFSAYSSMRMSDPSGLPQQETHRELTETIQRLVDMRRNGRAVFTSERVMWRYHRFLAGGAIGDCQAGRRFLVINPDGKLIPCAAVWAKYDSQRDMLREFTRHNTCDQCYISTRAGTEKGIKEFLVDNWGMLVGKRG